MNDTLRVDQHADTLVRRALIGEAVERLGGVPAAPVMVAGPSGGASIDMSDLQAEYREGTRELSKLLDRLARVVQGMKTEVSIDEDGIYVATKRVQSKLDRSLLEGHRNLAIAVIDPLLIKLFCFVLGENRRARG